MEVQKILKQKKKIRIPAVVEKDGVACRVVSIGKKVKTIIVGENVISIGTKSFYGCSKLKTVKFMGEKSPSIKKGAFLKTKSGCKFTVPKKCLQNRRKF